MTKIYFDYGEISSRYMHKFNNTISKLEELIRYQDDEDYYCPYDYWHRSYYIERYKDYIRNSLKEYISYRDLIEETNRKLNNALSEMDSNLSNIRNFELKKREEIVL